ncbi:hypothetical protein M514_07352 [Trichuris suis]|uniref:Uncharacterized protein n=1 Tax=Trichuris suis TaxID=68888 RepID=A0A085NFX1_9BILA|nr:hypothetical protein M513_07352 [Trichuris suis]KFD68367.1 hypothetical protein M514_07352 [Trichuris suis]
MHSFTVFVFSVLLARFCFEAEGLREDAAARMKCMRGDCRALRTRWHETGDKQYSKQYFQCLDDCIAEMLVTQNVARELPPSSRQQRSAAASSRHY